MSKGNLKVNPNHFTGLIAVALSLYYLIHHREDIAIFCASLFFIFVCTIDTFKSRIPNLLNVLLIVTGFTLNFLASGIHGLLLSLIGMALGFGLLVLPYIMGGLGAGDVKTLSALGALIGPFDLLHVFVYMGIFGGLFALLHCLYKQGFKESLSKTWDTFRFLSITQKINEALPMPTTQENIGLRFPYSSAIALGYYCFLFRGGVL